MKNLFFLLLFCAGMANAQIVNIPDANFKNRLIWLGIDTNADGQIQVSEAQAVNSTLNISGSSIADLTGFEAFTNVSILKCPNNQLTSITLTNLPNLKSIDAGFNTNLNTLNVTNVSLDTLKVYNNNMSNLNLSSLSSLKYLDCSYNHLTGLDLSGMSNLKSLNCTSNWLTALAVDTLTNLEVLECGSNQISSLNVIPLSNLKKLVCNNMNLTTLDVSNLTNLESLDWSNNQNNSFIFANVPNLKHLNCQGNTLTSLDVTTLLNLQDLNCSGNHLTTINVNGLVNLQTLLLPVNQLTSINVGSLTALQNLNVSSNQLSTLSVSGLTNLNYLYASNNTLTTIDLSGTNLNVLYVDYNQLASLDVAGMTHLIYLYCNNNLLTNLLSVNGDVMLQWLDCHENGLSLIDSTGATALETVLCDHNQLFSLDFSNNPHLVNLSCTYNSLTNINIKNGLPYINTNNFWHENPNLAFVCADDGELTFVQQILNQSINVNNGNVVFNSYCSFVPGGNYNTITGNITLDANNNGCDASDDIQPNIRININDGTTIGATFTNGTGNYSFFTQAGSFTLTPEIENPTWFTFSPTNAVIPFADNNNNSVTQSFCLAPNGIHRDVEMVIMPITPARPGFDAVYKLVYKNKGNQTSTVFLNFSYDDVVLDFVGASDAPSLATSGHLSWTVMGLQPFQSGSVLVTFHVNSPTDTPAVNIGDVLTFTSFIDVTTDENWEDNAFTLHQMVVGSYDPNEITCLEGDSVSVSEIGKYLHYSITFENTGNYLAENVVVKDVINTNQYDINSLQILGTSNPAYTKITGNTVEFIFQGINLAAAGGNPPVGGHGDVLFKIKSKNTLVAGDYVSKSAKIYFDYNVPITTNDAQTTFQNLSNPIHEFDNSVKVYPNPAHSVINIRCASTLQSVSLFDVQGRILETDFADGNATTFDISNHAKGVYFIKVNTAQGSAVQKVVKE
ncbi:DUF7619 domain-containing protein [Flavobacterium sp. XGLA_31]|uniref:DUF7619 domain-containing protein n=1 Tax=Flavobacterium sp. XGLA_31 TaxID=3447666 RepID=UPI003F312A6C